jgi:oligopeptidase B
VPFPESLSSVRVVSGFERDPRPATLGRGASAHFSFESFVRPATLFDYDPVARRLRETRRAAVHGYRPGDYASDRVFATAPDGTQIPVSLVYRRPLVLDGRRPLLLYGFGFVGLAAGPSFESERVSLLDRGVIFAVAHVRGGGDFGLAWHEAATGLTKMRTFTDFIACAEHLIAKGYTSSGGLAITGTSAGGMLVTAVANMRPDLMRAVVAKVPATVVIRRAPASDRLQENAELGNPNREADFNAMIAYAPYSFDYAFLLRALGIDK